MRLIAPANKKYWVENMRDSVDQPPDAPRVPLWAGDAEIGSVEADFFARALPANGIGVQGWVVPHAVHGVDGWQIREPVTQSLASIAFALRYSGFARAWRDEQIAVRDDQGHVWGTVERGVVRQLGVTTHAVHLVGATSQGRLWSQQRSHNKPNDPGRWDTMVGGMVPASDTREQALERETWEEAGLRMDQLAQLAHHGRITTRRPSGDDRGGYVVEHIDWYSCLVPDGVVPRNQDGEVAQFVLMNTDELHIKLVTNDFTAEAALILTAYGAMER